MEKKSLSQQTAERLYTMIAVERRLAPGRNCRGGGAGPGAGVSRTTPAGGHPRPGLPEPVGGPPGQGDLRHPRRRPGQRLRLFPTWTRSGELRTSSSSGRSLSPPPPGWPAAGPPRRRWRRSWPGEDGPLHPPGPGPDGGRPGVPRRHRPGHPQRLYDAAAAHDQPGGGRRHHLRPAQGPAGGGTPAGTTPCSWTSSRKGDAEGAGHAMAIPHAPLHGRHGAQGRLNPRAGPGPFFPPGCKNI